MNISPTVLMQQGGAWLAACRNWMLWNISFGSSIIWSDKTKLYQLTPYQMEEMCAHAVSAALAVHDVMAGKNKVVQTAVAIKNKKTGYIYLTTISGEKTQSWRNLEGLDLPDYDEETLDDRYEAVNVRIEELTDEPIKEN